MNITILHQKEQNVKAQMRSPDASFPLAASLFGKIKYFIADLYVILHK